MTVAQRSAERLKNEKNFPAAYLSTDSSEIGSATGRDIINADDTAKTLNHMLTLCAKRDVSKPDYALSGLKGRFWKMEMGHEEMLEKFHTRFTDNDQLKFIHLTNFIPQLHHRYVVYPLLWRMYDTVGQNSEVEMKQFDQMVRRFARYYEQYSAIY